MRYTSPSRSGLRLVTAGVSLAMLLFAPGKSWAPVEYMKVCTLYGAGFHYHPGTDICWNPANADARQQTEDGTWRWRMPPNPRKWVRAPKKACTGKLVPVAVASSSTLTENTRGRYETAPLPLVLEPGQYISAVIYQGGLSGTGHGNFCTFYSHDLDGNGNPFLAALGCLNTAEQAGTTMTASFTPDRSVPPPHVGPVSLVGAAGEDWPITSAADVGDSLSVWVCISKGK